MKKITLVVPVLCFVSAAHAQSGAEGEWETVVSTPPASVPGSSLLVATATPAEIVPGSEVVTVPSVAKTTPRRIVGDYDFGEVIKSLESSVEPLATQLQGGFKAFVLDIEDAVQLMEAGRTQEAVALSSAAIDAILTARDGIVEPLWGAQFDLNEEIAAVRSRLAKSLGAEDPTGSAANAAAESEQMLDRIARRISGTQDPLRRSRLVAHYRTIRDLSRIRAANVRMSPDQRKLWAGVLRVLEQASAAHQQVLMGSEVLFAQLDGTAMQLRDYLGLLQTVEGIDGLIGSVDGGTHGLQGFVDGMRGLQDQMQSFSVAVSDALEGSMIDLEVKVDAIQEVDADGSILQSGSIDEELQSRLNRLVPGDA